jgi:AraC-like DNA-binding protein
VAIPRRGVFVKHQHRQEAVADINGVMFFNAGDVYRVSHPLHGGDECMSLHFREDVIAAAVAGRGGAARFDPRQPFPHTHGPLSRAAFSRRRELDAAMSAPTVDPMAVEERALSLLDTILADSFAVRGHRPRRQRSDTAAAHRRWAEETRLVLNRRLGERVLLSDIARQVRCSPFHLVRVFRAHTGIPIHRYLNRLRLRAALERLRGGENDLTALALDLGFSSHSHFSDAFRAEFGTAPRETRR